MLQIGSIFSRAKPIFLCSVLLVCGLNVSAQAQNAQTNNSQHKKLVVYSARAEDLIKPVFDAYTKETGVKIEYITDKEGALLQRLKTEGDRSPADVLLTVDVGNLWFAAKEGVLQPVESNVLKTNVPANLRDTGNQWFGLSLRARTIFFNPKKATRNELSTYDDLASDKWRGRLCLRTSKKVYNQSLVAMLIAQYGVEKAEAIVKGWVANLAVPPFADDTQLLEAIASGQCAVGIANTYYFGRLMDKKPTLNLNIFWADQDKTKDNTSGVHVNVSGGGVTRASKQRELAVSFLEWLSSNKAQNLFADDNMEYPVNSSVKPAKTVANWGKFRANSMNITRYGEFQAQAVMLMDRVGYQ